MDYFELTPQRHPQSFGQFGGPCAVGDWPHDSQGRPLTHVLTLWEPQVSVFMPYRPDEYLLDVICYHGLAEELADLQTRVLFGTEGAPRSQGYVLPLRYLTPTTQPTGHLLGHADLLQNEPLNLTMLPALQLSGYDLPAECRDLFDAPENRAYLYLGDAEGLSFIQS